MNDCERLHQALEGGHDPGLDAEIAEHARSCASCAEALSVANRLRRLAREAPPRAGLPSASHLWWRAQIIRDLVARETLVEHATRSSRFMQSIGLGLLGLLGAFALSWLTAGLFGGLQTHLADDSMPWRWLAGLLLAGTAAPLAAFAALWFLWRES